MDKRYGITTLKKLKSNNSPSDPHLALDEAEITTLLIFELNIITSKLVLHAELWFQ